MSKLKSHFRFQRAAGVLILAAFCSPALAVDSEPVMKTAVSGGDELYKADVDSSKRLHVDSLVSSSALPTGAATSANQSTEITSLQLIDDIVHANDAVMSKGVPAMGQLDDVSTGTVTENNVSTVRITAARAFHVNLRNASGTEIGTSGNPVRTDPTGTTTQPVSGTVTANQGTSPWVTSAAQSGVWNLRLQDGSGNAITSQVSGTQRALDVGINVGGVQVDPRTRTWTLSNGTDSIAAVQSGTWTVQPGNTANTTPWLTTDTSDGPVTPGTVATKSSLGGAQYNTSAPAPTNGQQVALQANSAGALKVDGSAVTQPVNGTVTANQGTANTAANGWPVKLTDGTSTTAVKAASTAPVAADQAAVVALSPNGNQATAANQSTEITALQIIDNLPHANDSALSNGVPIMGQLDDASTGTVTENNVSTVRETAARGLHINLRNAAGTEIGTSSNRVFVDSSPAANVISTGNSSTATLGIGAAFTGTYEDLLSYADVTIIVRADQASATNGLVVEWSSDGTNVDDTDTYTIAANTGKQYSFGTMARYVRVRYTNGSVAQGSFRLQTLLKRTRGKPSSIRIGSTITDEDDAELVKSVITGKDANGVYHNLQTDTNGNLVITALTGFNANFSFGDVTTAAQTQVPVRRTAYTEPAAAAAFSIKSSSASDAAAGTGARTVKLTYMDSTGAGPFTETITLNGTTCVNSVTSTAKYFEKAVVVTVGSTGSNVGTLTMYTATACATTMGTIASTDNQTFWAHHYIPSTKSCNVTGLSVNHNGTTVGSGAVFVFKSLPIGVANAVEVQVGDFHRLYGQSSTIPRTYTSPIAVVGPARIIVYVTPETTSSTVYRASLDFFEP